VSWSRNVRSLIEIIFSRGSGMFSTPGSYISGFYSTDLVSVLIVQQRGLRIKAVDQLKNPVLDVTNPKATRYEPLSSLSAL
jgi:hypothetical protein